MISVYNLSSRTVELPSGLVLEPHAAQIQLRHVVQNRPGAFFDGLIVETYTPVSMFATVSYLDYKEVVEEEHVAVVDYDVATYIAELTRSAPFRVTTHVFAELNGQWLFFGTFGWHAT